MAEKGLKNMITARSSSMKLGLIVRGDDTGLGNQTRNLTYMLKPDRILYINSKPFNGNEQHFDWYENYTGIQSIGFPDNQTIRRFIDGLTHIVTAETFYSYELIRLANRRGIKTFNQVNYEFCDHLRQQLPMPYLWLMPSYWKIEEMTAKFENVKYLPPPIFTNDFKRARETNFERDTTYRRFVHIVGKPAEHDRNGTEDVLRALEFCKSDFELVIRSQYPLPYQINDKRVTFDIGNKSSADLYQLYEDYDLLIMPRRYGGLCLPMNEALCSALPVLMTDVSPNNRVLPEAWLVQAKVQKQFMTRTMIDCYMTDLKDLARKIDYFATMPEKDLAEARAKAFEIGFENYDADNLRERYKEVLEL
jgi:glycosyltransferase involved in cell wall biosynthesis